MLKEEIRVSLTRHSELIALLAKIGAARGHDIWIGQREQRETVIGLVEEIKLRDLVTAKPASLKGVKESRDPCSTWICSGSMATKSSAL